MAESYLDTLKKAINTNNIQTKEANSPTKTEPETQKKISKRS